jgi:hypothetical protein
LETRDTLCLMLNRKMIRWSATSLFLGGVAVVWGAWGCDTLWWNQHTVDDPVSAEADTVDLVGAPDFHFTMGDGSGLGGFNVIKIGADGRCEYAFFELVQGKDAKGSPVLNLQWKRAEFTLDAKTLAEFRGMLAEVNFFAMKKEYIATNILDGTQRFAKVVASGKRKAVYCSNYFPPRFERIRVFVNDKIIAAHPAEIGAAKMIQPDRKDWESESFD